VPDVAICDVVCVCSLFYLHKGVATEHWPELTPCTKPDVRVTEGTLICALKKSVEILESF
jgi:hypothetical protein